MGQHETRIRESGIQLGALPESCHYGLHLDGMIYIGTISTTRQVKPLSIYICLVLLFMESVATHA